MPGASDFTRSIGLLDGIRVGIEEVVMLAMPQRA